MGFEKYRPAYYFYLDNCKKHNISCEMNFHDFIDYLTVEQMELMLEHSLVQI